MLIALCVGACGGGSSDSSVVATPATEWDTSLTATHVDAVRLNQAGELILVVRQAGTDPAAPWLPHQITLKQNGDQESLAIAPIPALTRGDQSGPKPVPTVIGSEGHIWYSGF